MMRALGVERGFKDKAGGKMTLDHLPLAGIVYDESDAELIGVDDVMSPILWTRLFLEAQGIKDIDNILHQDNKSAILLEENGKASSGKRTRALNIRFFFVTDNIKKGNLRVVYCPTADMRGDYQTKPLQGKTFWEHRRFIMGHDNDNNFGSRDSS